MTIPTDLPRDFRYAARSLLGTPGFTVVVVAVAMLALGIGHRRRAARRTPAGMTCSTADAIIALRHE